MVSQDKKCVTLVAYITRTLHYVIHINNFYSIGLVLTLGCYWIFLNYYFDTAFPYWVD